MAPPQRPTIIRRKKGCKPDEQEEVVAAHKVRALTERARHLMHFSYSKVVGHYADAYDVDDVRVRRAIVNNARAHDKMAETYKILLPAP